ncbi:hypothetical protein NJC10_00245 [Micrococcus sp. M4NT]|uniref:hypothetical protein n=1 Tax=Micrococcus sp. M4NT TaxID=2957501 RepID=UPI0029A11D11|nr:hypothetical protein [Micrococcus sp. M4NT]MDX2340111.1 hypothetical protein [Micrococcus sp. M4NT]
MTAKTPTPGEVAAFIRVILDHHKPRIDTDTGRHVRKYLLEAAASLDKAADKLADKEAAP